MTIAQPSAKNYEVPLQGGAAGEFVLTAADFKSIAGMLHADAGIYLPESKSSMVYSRLAKRLRTLGLKSFRDYCELVGSVNGVDERQQMLAALTTNVTRFFREPHHFDHLKKTVLPPLLDEARRGGRVRIWSAACSSGQEPYSIALTLLSLMNDASRYDIKILATDIDPNMVAEASRGVYADNLMTEVPKEFRERWFNKQRDDGSLRWSVSDALRDLVSFRELNLIGNWPMKGSFQVIFCRNVVIYFEDDTQKKIWSRFQSLLSPGGRLFIGHSERVSGPAAQGFESEGITTYRLRKELR
jgi:chemotaxis protein methyltransferase CheR